MGLFEWARRKHFTKNAPKPQKVASRAGETPTCENEIVSRVGPNSFPKWGPQYLATLPSFLTTCPHQNHILENALGDIFTSIFWDASQALALGWPGPRTWPAGHFFLSHLCGEITLKFLLSFLEPPPKGHRPGNAWGNAGGNPWGNARTTMWQRVRKAFYRKASQASKSRFPCRRNAYLRK